MNRHSIRQLFWNYCITLTSRLKFSRATSRSMRRRSSRFGMGAAAYRSLSAQAESLEPRAMLAITAVNVDSLANDVDGDGVADPGDKIHYTVTVSNTGGADVTDRLATLLVAAP